MQQAMVEYFEAHRDRAGQGLELLPGVKELLLALKVGPGSRGWGTWWMVEVVVILGCPDVLHASLC